MNPTSTPTHVHTAHYHIRAATAADMAAVAVIFNHAVRHTFAIWQENEVSETERQQWLAARQQAGFPVLVAVDERDNVYGFASYGDFRPYAGYRHTVEHSVYVAPASQGQGIGSRLLHALISDAQNQHKKIMVAAIDSGNHVSIQLHQKYGFIQTGLMPKVGYKFGCYLDLVLMQKEF